ncbi:LytTR family transcriptional regulator [Litoribacter ruber]|uniref:LytR/AlgR family response regulator transcription factor n=1 Tax=Litoribacter ruber TaxID=702568 RepID=UPI001BD95E27|nr:LytTR family DNA-binding domain-containing protein [Litoribacter ruber]MBT0812468.1 LytTR family transcriptional regulator [Litoribacter ruber]
MGVENQFINCIIVHRSEDGYKWSHKFQNVNPFLKTVEVLASWEEAYNYVEKGNKVDLIVGSYDLTDMHPFIFEKLDMRIPVIFTSPKPFITEKALSLNCLDFINENADQERIRKSFEKFQVLYSIQTGSSPSGPFSSEPQLNSNQKSRFMVKSGDSFLAKMPSEVAFFLADNGQTYLYEMGTGERFTINQKLMDLEADVLDPREFFRINRSVLININAIGPIQKHINSRLKITPKIQFHEELVVSREKVTAFKKWVNQ